ncbi:MAG: hypothetical protein PVJ27_09745 [Candidatus Brocadiaceae bacterium]|jgi:hypothetical protein
MERRRASARRHRTRRIAERIPRELKILRAKLMLEDLYEYLGVEEVSCPACRGTGWLEFRRLEFCPLCCGFREVPDRLADWFRNQLARLRARQESRTAPRHIATGDRSTLTTTAGGGAGR